MSRLQFLGFTSKRVGEIESVPIRVKSPLKGVPINEGILYFEWENLHQGMPFMQKRVFTLPLKSEGVIHA